MAERWLSQQGAGRYPRASQESHILQSLEVPAAEGREAATPPSIRRNGLRASVLDMETSPGRERAFRTGNERLYEAYNDLHSLAQDFEKPFDAPAILVVGHQTDGKSGGFKVRAQELQQLAGPFYQRGRRPAASPAALPSPPQLNPSSASHGAALVEALMGFQFNHVGGGTKTRRPITLHMKYNSACVQPHCYLVTEEFGEQEVTLEELQVRAGAGTGWGGRISKAGLVRLEGGGGIAGGRPQRCSHDRGPFIPCCLPGCPEASVVARWVAAVAISQNEVWPWSPPEGQPVYWVRVTGCRATLRMRMRGWTGRGSSGTRRLWSRLSTSSAPTSPSSTPQVLAEAYMWPCHSGGQAPGLEGSRQQPLAAGNGKV